MDYTIESIERDTIKITIGSGNHDVVVTPVVIKTLSYLEEEADISVSPTITPTAGVYTLTGNSGDEYEITFNEDGVYKLYITEDAVDYLHYITEDAVDYLHYVIVSNAVDDFFEEQIPELIDADPIVNCDGNVNCKKHYDFTVLTIFSANFFGETNEYVYLNYKPLTTGSLYQGFLYQCTNIGSGTYNWKDANNNNLLVDMAGNAVDDDAALELNAYYRCIHTGTPANYGGTTKTNLTLETEQFVSYINRVVDSLANSYKYIQTCIDPNL